MTLLIFYGIAGVVAAAIVPYVRRDRQASSGDASAASNDAANFAARPPVRPPIVLPTKDYVVLSVAVSGALPQPALKPPAAWFAIISGRFLAGPYYQEALADRAGKNARNVGNKVDIGDDPEWHRTVRRIYRADLSAPPIQVWEFSAGKTSLFAVADPEGWAGPMSKDPAVAKADAARRAAIRRSNLEGPANKPQSEP